jgi:hypothetical protein
MHNPKNKKAKENPIFKPGYNIAQRVAFDNKMRAAEEYAAR